jgi:hypothetical protein
MIAEAVDPDKASLLSAARLSFSIGQGESAVLASEEGRSIKLTCGADAQTIAVNAAGKKESGRSWADGGHAYADKYHGVSIMTENRRTRRRHNP